MFNIIKADLYRLSKSAYSYVILILAMFFAAVNTAGGMGYYNTLHTELKEMGYYIDEGDITIDEEDIAAAEEYDEGWVVTINEREEAEVAKMLLNGELTFGYLLNDNALACMVVSLMMSVFAVIYACGDFSGGYIKNLAGKRSKFTLAFSRYITMLIALAVCFALSAAAVAAAAQITLAVKDYDLSFVSGGAKEFFKIFGMQYLFNAALIAIIYAFIMVTRNTAVSMCIAVAFSSGMTSIAYYAATHILKKVFDLSDSFYFGTYFPDTLMTDFSLSAAGSELQKMCVAGAAFIVGFVFIGTLVFKKRDIN